jgi:two-component system chemotaxis response regulator CheY
MNSQGKKVMIVDDSKAMIMLLKRILEGNGYQIIGEVQSGEEAVARYDELKPDLVTMDLILPGISGIDAVKRILQNDPKACIVAVSSVGGTPEKLMEALKAGARNVISKPFNPEKVVKILNDALSAHSALLKGEK